MVFAIWRIVALTVSNVECTVSRMCLKSVAICRHAGQSQKPTASPSWMPPPPPTGGGGGGGVDLN